MPALNIINQSGVSDIKQISCYYHQAFLQQAYCAVYHIVQFFSPPRTRKDDERKSTNININGAFCNTKSS
jgi:hypothetical protein